MRLTNRSSVGGLGGRGNKVCTKTPHEYGLSPEKWRSPGFTVFGVVWGLVTIESA